MSAAKLFDEIRDPAAPKRLVSYVEMSLAKVEAGERHGAGAGRELTRGGDAQERGAGGAEVSVHVRLHG